MDIRVIGDIRVGKIQPSLTGNPVIDDSLIENYCKKLKQQIKNLGTLSDVIGDHFFNPNNPANDIFLIDRNIMRYIPEDFKIGHKIISINHNDIIRGNVSEAIQVLSQDHFLNQRKAQ